MGMLTEGEEQEIKRDVDILFAKETGKSLTGDGNKLNFYVDNRALYLAVRSIYDDIDRYKKYHQKEGNLSDCVKRSAYACKWICRFKADCRNE